MRAFFAFSTCLGFAVLSGVSGPAFAVGESVGGFPNWRERTIHEFMNRSRCDPQADLAACPAANCLEKACYTAKNPLYMDANLNRVARFHSDEMKQQTYFAHDSACTVVSNISSIYPGSCNGAASCACVGGTKTCSPTCTAWNGRAPLFSTSFSGEIIASTSDPQSAFYMWLYEKAANSNCGYSTANGHRYNILTAGPSVGVGVNSTGSSVGDFGGAAAGTYKIPSGSHYPQTGASLDMWANWKDTAAPSQANVNVEGKCTAMTRKVGTAQNGGWSVTLTGLGTTCQRYRFEFKDSAGATVTFPQTGSYYIGTNCATDGSDFSSNPPPNCGCTPSCGGKQCGDDGCGSVCGTCGGGTTCQSNQCVGNGNPDGGTAADDAGSGITDTTTVEPTGCSCDLTAASSNRAAPFLAGFAVLFLAAFRRRARRTL
ncbi:MAG TPA: hypothetical protein PKE31_03460 [Pseudomonadota bacterium]|jgi:hypothetical protein|nr:hypothetical protein [Pseudomonadota bacterium]